MNITEKPFTVVFLAKTFINNGYKDFGEILIQSKWIVSTITPIEDNLIGWNLSDFEQQYQRKDYENICLVSNIL